MTQIAVSDTNNMSSSQSLTDWRDESIRGEQQPLKMRMAAYRC